jgi:GntR family transcriptional regulator, transcriptional repressor for pyruvate dehydrogenase complex
MLAALKPVQTKRLKEICAGRLEEWILSGELPVGKKLPPERDLARHLGVSRPVVHEALVEIAAKGLVSLVPRVGSVVNDYRREGSIALLTSLLQYHSGRLAPGLLDGLLSMRILFEVEFAALAALNRTDAQLADLRALVHDEARTDPVDTKRLTTLDFAFHHCVAMATGNPCYPLLLNSFKPLYTNLSGQFFGDPAVVPEVVRMHAELVDTIARGDENEATAVMWRLLAHGEARLRVIIADPGLLPALKAS